MRDYDLLAKSFRHCAEKRECASCPMYVKERKCPDFEVRKLAADAIEELLAFAKFVAREAIDTGGNDGVSAEILCRKLNKLGLIETDGEFWMLPEPPKEE